MFGRYPPHFRPAAAIRIRAHRTITDRMAPKTPILAIETSNPAAPTPESPPSRLTGPGVCVLGHDGAVFHAPLEPVDRHDDALLPAIDRACSEAGVAKSDLGRIGVSIGPGGYTSIRIAVSVAKSIGEALGIGCVGVPTAQALVRALSLDGPSVVALAWKREDVWVQGFEGLSPEGEGRVVRLDELSGLAQGRTLVAEARLREKIGYTGDHADPFFSAEAVALLALEGTPVDPGALLPLYPREPEAVRKWHALKR